MRATSRQRRCLGAVALLVTGGVATAAAQTSPERVAWVPSNPVQGSLVQIVFHTSHPPAITGTLAGQPLHFAPDAQGRARALAAIPIGSKGSIPLILDVAAARDSTERVVMRIPVRAGDFGVERLRVNPRFTTPPDSALAARIAEESAKSRRVSQRSHGTARLWHTGFERPSPGRITSPYGKGREFNGTITSRHLGTDFDGDVGDAVTAVNRGVVALVGDFYYSGNIVYLDHGHGLVTAYLHLSEALVAAGDTVERGQLIGRIGATGRVTGPHLHLIARYGTVSVNPMDLFEMDFSAFREPDLTPQPLN